MADPTAALKEIFDRHPASPFLFVGSGFSRRYLGIEDWAGLLARFCAPINEFGYYSSRANGSLPLVATYMADDFNEWWWKAEEAADSRAAWSGHIQGQADALKFEISSYIGAFSLENARGSAFGDEIASFSEMSVDGVITTNWDHLLEELFPDYKVFVGQEELLFSNPQSIGEIYKIHGSVEDPRSLILTASDYDNFASKNPYLAAKLVTIFVEHPIVFLGYSIADPHIRSIITSIARCLPQSKIAAFEENLIFVQRAKGEEEPNIEKATIQTDEFSVAMMVVKVTDFKQVYSALAGNKRKIPARLLRFFKEQFYELIRTPAEKENKIAVIDYDEIGSAENVEFVVGVGVAKRQQDFTEKADQRVQSALAKRGYAGVEADEVFTDCLLPESKFDAADLLETAYPIYGRSNRTYMPVFRYLNAVGIDSMEALLNSKYEGAKKVVQKMAGSSFTAGTQYASRFKNSFAGLSTTDIIAKAAGLNEALLMLPYQPAEEVDLNALQNFLRADTSKPSGEPYVTAYRKLVCRYDRLRFGF